MAIKERKQITGTTAQINAYEGHEGQIVWDKEKKTFVGMSGTAGKNYPLAPKEYVDNEVAKCLPKTDGQNVEAITSRGGDWRQGYIRYASGIQICWSIDKPTNEVGGASFGFPVPFASAPYVVASLQGNAASRANWSFVYEEYAGGGKTGANIWLLDDGAPSPNNTIKCFAIGFWK